MPEKMSKENGKDRKKPFEKIGIAEQFLALFDLSAARSPLLKKYEDFLLEDSGSFYKERNHRAKEAESLRTSEAPEIANELLPASTATVLCMDGRMGTVRVFLMGAGIGSASKSAGGFVPECVKGEGDELVLLKETRFAQDLMGLAKKAKKGRLAQVLVSHTACAAAGGELAKLGRTDADGGLKMDVQNKRQACRAMAKFVEANVPACRLMPIQFTFDILNGYGYMGLETDTAMRTVSEKEGFTASELERLAKEKTLISTKEIAGELDNLFSRLDKNRPDWREDYKVSLESAWKNIRKLAKNEEVKRILSDKIKTIYPHLASIDEPEGKKKEDAEAELQERMMLLLLNSFAGYLNNIDGYQNEEHKEHSVRVGDREFGPFNTEVLGVSGSNLSVLTTEIGLAVGIVRKNRVSGKTPGDPEAPVSLRVEKVVRGINQKDWDLISSLDFSDLKDMNWFTVESGLRGMSDEKFREYVSGKATAAAKNGHELSHVSFEQFFLAINRLREKMTLIYRPGGLLSSQVMNGNIFPIPALSDRNRCTRLIVPFFVDHFTEDSA